ncbi:Myc-type [Macleaya cordata]|uniref:Myc-type n=1 Tax=Macleaya cordata TaxID=56857 RepID=A0A200QDN4_MACCD|nr:Myc-type [Macleaya cordata]
MVMEDEFSSFLFQELINQTSSSKHHQNPEIISSNVDDIYNPILPEDQLHEDLQMVDQIFHFDTQTVHSPLHHLDLYDFMNLSSPKPPDINNIDHDVVDPDEAEENNDPIKLSSSAMNCKNLVSERNRRKRLSQQMLALRSLVPNITKMDKRSVLSDAFAYLKSIHEEIAKLEKELKGQQPRLSITSSRETNCPNSSDDYSITVGGVGRRTLTPTPSISKSKSIIITEIDAEKIEKRRYIVKIKWEGSKGRGGGGDGGEIIRVMESLNFDMTSTSIDHINPQQFHAQFFIRVQKEGKMSEEMLKECITTTALRHGINTVQKSDQNHQVHQQYLF